MLRGAQYLEAPAELEFQPGAFGGKRLRSGKNLRRGRSDFAGGALPILSAGWLFQARRIEVESRRHARHSRSKNGVASLAFGARIQ
jgi:hypothetical protein